MHWLYTILCGTAHRATAVYTPTQGQYIHPRTWPALLSLPPESMLEYKVGLRVATKQVQHTLRSHAARSFRGGLGRPGRAADVQGGLCLLAQQVAVPPGLEALRGRQGRQDGPEGRLRSRHSREQLAGVLRWLPWRCAVQGRGRLPQQHLPRTEGRLAVRPSLCLCAAHSASVPRSPKSSPVQVSGHRGTWLLFDKAQRGMSGTVVPRSPAPPLHPMQ